MSGQRLISRLRLPPTAHQLLSCSAAGGPAQEVDPQPCRHHCLREPAAALLSSGLQPTAWHRCYRLRRQTMQLQCSLLRRWIFRLRPWLLCQCRKKMHYIDILHKNEMLPAQYTVLSNLQTKYINEFTKLSPLPPTIFPRCPMLILSPYMFYSQ